MIWPGTLFFSLIKFSAWSGVSGYTRKRPDYLTRPYLGQNIFTENHRFPDQTCQNIFRKYSQEATVFSDKVWQVSDFSAGSNSLV